MMSGRDHRTAAGSVAAPMTTPPPRDSREDEPLRGAAPPAGRPPAGVGARARARWAVARSRGRVSAARGAALGRGVIWDLAPGARVRLGDGCAIGERTRVHVVGDGTAHVGSGTVLGERCVVQTRTAVTVGAGARLADEVALLDHRPVIADAERPLRRQGVSAAAITIGDRARIGPRTVIGAGVTVGPDAQVGANLVIEADVPAGARVDGPGTPRVVPAG